MARLSPHLISGLLITAVFPWITWTAWVDSEVFPRWQWVYAIAAVSGFVLLVRNPIVHWTHSSRSRILVSIVGCLIAIATLVTTANYYPGLLPGQILDWSAFALLAYYVSWLSRQNRLELMQGLAYGAASMGAAISFWQVLTWSGPNTAFELRFFGFQNHWAEYLGFGLVGMLAIRGPVRISSLLVSPLIFGLAFTHCRSVLLGVSAAALAIAFVQLRARRSAWVAISIIVLGALPFGVSKSLRLAETRTPSPILNSVVPERGFDLETVKAGNATLRLKRWINSLALVRDHSWFGHGLGGFEFAYRKLGQSADPETTPQNVVRSPHNAYLELAVETGLPIAFTLLCLIGFILRAFASRHFVRALSPLPLGLLVYWMADGVFAFPLELPFPFLTAAGLFGVFVGEYNPSPVSNTVPLPKGRRQLGSMMAISCLLAMVGIGATLSFNANQALIAPNLSACQNFPSVWRSCLRAVDHLATQGNWDDAWHAALENEKRFPGVDFFQWQKGALYQASVVRALYFGLPVR